MNRVEFISAIDSLPSEIVNSFNQVIGLYLVIGDHDISDIHLVNTYPTISFNILLKDKSNMYKLEERLELFGGVINVYGDVYSYTYTVIDGSVNIVLNKSTP